MHQRNDRMVPGSWRQTTVFVLVCALLVAGGCAKSDQTGAESTQPLPSATPILLFGVDGLEWDVMLPMLKAGRLPNYAKLMERGYYGELETAIPTLSPVIWTTIATGKPPQKHGIPHFARRLPGDKVTLYNNFDRRTKAIWNIVSDAGKSVTSIGWWMTHPVEPINGVMIAQTNTVTQLDTRAGKHVWKGTLRKGAPDQVYPPHRQNEMIAILEEVHAELSELTQRIFGKFAHPLSLLGQRLWGNCLWTFRADETYYRIAMKLIAEGSPGDLTLLYFGGTDVVGHRFWRYMLPNLYTRRPTDEQIANFGTVVEDYYAYTDAVLGKLLGVYGPAATVIVVSDHGMKPVNRNARFNPDSPPANINSAEHQRGPPGVFLAAGPGIRKLPNAKPLQHLSRKDLIRVCSVYDITPTILAMLRVPLGQGMDGQVALGVFRDDFQIDRQPDAVPTHDTADYFANRGRKHAEHPGEQERLRQLRSLGYIDGGKKD